MSAVEHPSRLARRLGTYDAVVIGLGAMIGAGIFAVIGPAARVAGAGLVIGLAIAAIVAYCNALSSAQLAALYPQSGGAYVYGRERLGSLPGFLAGWAFVVGKFASCAAMAMTFAAHAAPAVMRPVAIASVLALTAVNYFGIRKTAMLTRIVVALVVATLAAFVVVVGTGAPLQPERLLPATGVGLYAVLQSAGLWFFAFAGYARLATLGEEVVDPDRVIPRAIPVALALTLLIYGAVAVTALLAVDTETLARSDAPLVVAAQAAGASDLAAIVRFGASVASLGVLLSLIVGVSRTVFAMAANGDLPGFLSAVHPRYHVPHRAELAVGILVASAATLVDLRDAIGFSAFTVLVYYGLTNASALTLNRAERRWPQGIAIAGLVGCATLALTLPPGSILVGAVVLACGAAGFLIRRRSAVFR